jgi:hypothetical protein
MRGVARSRVADLDVGKVVFEVIYDVDTRARGCKRRA